MPRPTHFEKGPDLIGATLGQYQIEALIGQGGMGYVYRARDTMLARSVALKILPPEVVSDASRLSRFVQEARAASALNHPHVVAIYEIREAPPSRDGAPIAGLPSLHYLAMELVAGDTLRTLIETRRLESKRAIDLLVQVAEALSAAHAAGVVHRDLKPENIMVATSGYAKVLDFGLAKLRPDLLEAGKVGIIMGFQNAAMMGEDATRVDIFAGLGVKIIQLTYNPRNQLGDGSIAPRRRERELRAERLPWQDRADRRRAGQRLVLGWAEVDW